MSQIAHCINYRNNPEMDLGLGFELPRCQATTPNIRVPELILKTSPKLASGMSLLVLTAGLGYVGSKIEGTIFNPSIGIGASECDSAGQDLYPPSNSTPDFNRQISAGIVNLEIIPRGVGSKGVGLVCTGTPAGIGFDIFNYGDQNVQATDNKALFTSTPDSGIKIIKAYQNLLPMECKTVAENPNQTICNLKEDINGSMQNSYISASITASKPADAQAVELKIIKSTDFSANEGNNQPAKLSFKVVGEPTDTLIPTKSAPFVIDKVPNSTRRFGSRKKMCSSTKFSVRMKPEYSQNQFITKNIGVTGYSYSVKTNGKPTKKYLSLFDPSMTAIIPVSACKIPKYSRRKLFNVVEVAIDTKVVYKGRAGRVEIQKKLLSFKLGKNGLPKFRLLRRAVPSKSW